MAQVSRDDLLHLAKLSKLQLDESEIPKLQGDIANILNYVEQLKELNTDGVGPTYQVTGLENVWREDEVVYSVAGRDDMLSLAKAATASQVKVPKVL